MKFKKTLVAAALVAMMVPLAACSSSTSGTAADPTPISWWTWDANQAVSYQKCAAAFNKANPTIKVTVSNYDWNDYWTKITAGFVSGTAPDTFMDHTSYYPQFASKHELMPLDSFVKKNNIDLSLYGSAVSSFKYTDGKLYAIPKDTASIVFYYNEADVKAAGLTDKDMQNMTWNPTDGGTFNTVVSKLSVDDKGVHGDQPGFDASNVKTYGIGPMSEGGGNGQDTWSGFAASTGWTQGNKANYPTQYQYDQPIFKQTLNYLRNLSTKGFSPKQGVFTNAVEDQVGSGKIAMVYDPTSDVVAMSSIKGVKVGIAPSVIGPKGRDSLVNSNADSISASTKHPAQAEKWVAYLDSDACQSLAGKDATFFPVLQKSLNVTYQTLESKGIDTTVFKNLYKENQFFTTPTAPGGTAMDAALNPLWEKYFGFQANDSIFDQMTATSKQILATAYGK
jgi:ABC-type glycerol-3-phosphate transport system substrate-binding protein